MAEPIRRLRVLMLDGSRQALPFYAALKRAGHHVTAACPSRICEGYFSRFPDRRLLWPEAYKAPAAFTAAMLDYVRRHRPDVTLAVEDSSARIVAEHKTELVRWTRVTVPDREVFDRAADKTQTMAYCMANGIPCPRTFLPDRQELGAFLSQVPFPMIFKPRRGIGAVGIRRVDTAEELAAIYEPMRARYGEMLLQEYIPIQGGTQFQAEAFLDGHSKMQVCVVIAKPRFFPVTGGTSTANVTIHRPDIRENVRRLLEGIGWSGPADVDLIFDPRDRLPKVLEINPRVTAGIRIGFAAGVDYADLHLRLAMGQPIPRIDRYKLGVYSRNLLMDVLWYLYSDRQARRACWPPFFKFFGTDVVYQLFSPSDPLPALGFLLGMIRKYTTRGTWKEKLGRDLTPE